MREIGQPKDLEKFISDMQEYFTAMKITEHLQVSMASMFMLGDDKLQYITRTKEDVKVVCPRIETWETLKNELWD